VVGRGEVGIRLPEFRTRRNADTREVVNGKTLAFATRTKEASGHPVVGEGVGRYEDVSDELDDDMSTSYSVLRYQIRGSCTSREPS
jgi:hypothetical protein